MPHLRKIAVVNLQIRLGEENLAARMRVIPTHWLESIRFAADVSQDVLQAFLVSRGERKRGPEYILALNRLVVENLDLPVSESPEQDPSDFHSAVRYHERGIYYRQTNLFEDEPRVEDLERSLRHLPAFHLAGVGHHFTTEAGSSR